MMALVDYIDSKRVTDEEIKGNNVLRGLAQRAAMEKLRREDAALVDSSLDMIPLGSAGKTILNAADKAVVTAANKVPVYIYDPETYKGLAKGLSGSKPVDVSDSQAWTRMNPNGNIDDRLRYESSPNYRGYMEPSTLQYAAKDEVSKTHELQHAKDYLSGKPAGSSPGEMGAVIEDMARYNYPPGLKEKVTRRLYLGNLGERKANLASVAENNGLVNTKYHENVPMSEIANREYPISDLVEMADKAAHTGIANTITYKGLANKRDLLGYSPHYSNLRPGRSKDKKGIVAGAGVGLAGIEAYDSLINKDKE